MRHSSTKNTGLFGKSVSVLIAMLLMVSMVAVAFTAMPTTEAADSRVKIGDLADSAKAHWVEATYFDYLSDAERSGSWLSPIKAGTNYNGAENNWYPLNDFNSYISKSANKGSYPLYFGNFCNTPGAYASYNAGVYSLVPRKGPYTRRVTEIMQNSPFSYIANNSNAVKKWTGSGYDFGYAVQGLAKSQLVNGNIQATGASGTMPYFDESLESKGYAKIIKSYFPFRQRTIGSDIDEVREYTFDSDKTDNVFFNWASPGTPNSVNYGQGSASNLKYAVQDGLKDFMNETPGYGIFPFNNKDSATAGNRGGNSNLDYGFGIRMDFDFKVPANGTYPDAAKTHAKFTYSGDDDLWVYMAEYKDDGTLGASKLVLDLGGNHKESAGDIDFATMKSTAYKVVDIADSTNNSKNGYSSDYIYISDDNEWGFIDSSHTVKKKNVEHNDDHIHASNVPNLEIKAWSGTNTGEFFTPEWDDDLKLFKISKYAKGSGKDNADNTHNGAQLKDMDSFLVTEITDGSKVDTQRMSDHFSVSSSLGKVIYTSDNTVTTPYEKPVYRSGSVVKQLNSAEFGYTTKDSGSGVSTLDPSKKYRMSIFYMERGTIESNCSMGFTLTPADNEFKAEKDVDASDVNSAALQQAIKDSEEYTLTAKKGTSEYSDTVKNGGTVDFSSKFKTGTEVSLSETYTSALSYTTTYTVKDQINNTSTSGSGKDANVKIEDTKTHSDDDAADILVTFKNKVNVADVKVSKEILAKKPGASTYTKADGAKDDFTYTMYVNIKGTDNNADYKTYNLKYNDSAKGERTMTNGTFTFNSDDTVTVPGLPVGATYKLVESSKAGYEPDPDVTDTIKGTVGSNANAQFKNRQVPTDTKIEFRKNLDGTAYTGKLFRFTLSGVGAMAGSKDNKDQTKTIDAVTNGKAAFTPDDSTGFLVFNEAGTYLYKLVESGTADAYKNDINNDSSIYLVKVEVAPGEGSKLEAKATYKKTDKKDGYTADDFNGGSAVAPTFDNTVKKGSAKVIKTNQANQKLDDTTFSIYKTTGENAALGAKLSTKTTGKDGQAKGEVVFDNLSIYEDGYTSSSAPEYQWYCIVEEKSATGYTGNDNRVYFRLPKLDERDNIVKYDFTFEYVNGRIVAPQTAGEGDFFRLAGLGVIALSLMLFAAFIYRGKRYTGTRYSD